MNRRMLTTVSFAGLLLAAMWGESIAQPPKREKAADKAVVVFETYQDGGGSFRFRLKHDDHILAMSSKGYESLADCRKVIAQIQKEAANAKIVAAPKDDK